MNLRLSIVIPVYGSETLLERLVEEVDRVAVASGWKDRFELVLVNDASPDGSWAVVRRLAERYAFVRGLSLRRNFGQHSAAMAGMNHARGEFIVLMDDDLQHPPAEIPKLLRALEEGADVCYTRYVNRQHARWKVLGSRFNNFVASVLLDKPADLYLSSFKALRRGVVAEIVRYDGPYPYIDGLILDVTRAISVVDIQHQPRPEGEGNYSLRRSLSLWMRMATSFSVFPLRVATMLGFALTAVALVAILAVLAQKLRHPEWPAGWASLIATILFVGGVQTFCVGMLGEYLGRAYLRLNRKPQFVVGEKTWRDESDR